MKAARSMSPHIQKNVALHPLTTLKVGGIASAYVSVTSETELIEAVRYAQQELLPVYLLGGGSNVLVSDKGLSGLVIHIQSKGSVVTEVDDKVHLRVQAGEIFDAVVLDTVSQGWWGLENLSHIPGTVGATPVQNVGAYGVEIKDLIDSVRVFNTETMSFEMLNNEQCAFAYRDSLFKSPEGKKYIITEVTFLLSKKECPKISYIDLKKYFEKKNFPSLVEVRNAVISIRSHKFPNWHEVGTAGSFFKNPMVSEEKYAALQTQYPGLPGYKTKNGMVKIALGWVLDKVLQLRGYREGFVSTYTEQALVLITHEGATAEEIEHFANSVIEKLKIKIGVLVEWEVTRLQ